MLKKLRQRWVIFLVVAVLIFLTVVTPPSRSLITDGSSYNRNPNGYAAWYAYMEKQGTVIKRWQDPLLVKYFPQTPPITLIRIKPELDMLDYNEQEWLEQGNNLIILGIRADVTEAPFTTIIPSSAGAVKIQTRRRQEFSLTKPFNEKLAIKLTHVANKIPLELRDQFGKILWAERIESSGTLITATTPFLGANAYQNEPGNFQFLADLVTGLQAPVYIDEYIHGYRNPNSETLERRQTWYDYLMNTPLFVAMVQALVFLLVLLWGQNYRFGAIALPKPEVANNSKVYIEALASVLQKAGSYEFVYKAIAKDQQRQLLRQLGVPMGDRQALLTAWEQQTGRPAAELELLLTPPDKITDQNLLNWLQSWQKLLVSLSTPTPPS